MTKPFRLSAKRLFLTFPHCPLSKDTILNELNSKLQGELLDYVISKELHSNGEPHIHIYLRLKRTKNIKNPHFYDILGHHGKYQAVKSVKNVINYITKYNDFITNLPILNGEILELKPYLINLVRHNKLQDALDTLKNCQDPSIISSYSNWKSNLIKLHDDLYPQLTLSNYKLEDFNFPKEILDWHKNPKKTLVVQGPTGVGKTQGMLALLADDNPLVIRERQDFKLLNKDHKSIILDDISLSDFDINDLKHIFDSEVPSSIRVLYASVRLDPNLKKVVLVNVWSLPHASPQDSDAVLRRIVFVNLKDSLINKITTTTTVSTTTTVETILGDRDS